MTLSAAAQTGDDGADDADPQGRIIARIQDRTDDDGVDDYRIEFGFFPQWAMEDKDPWAEAITTWSDWLPRARYLTKTVIDRRDADDNRRWLRSSLISVPAGPLTQQDGSPDADFGGGGDDQQDLIEGRVVARYNPDSRGRLRVEFGFLPECAFETTSNTEEAVEQYGEDLLPRARYLSASMIESRRGVWLRSSVVDVPSTCTTDPRTTITLTGSPHSFGQGQEIEEPVRVGVVVGELTTELDPITFARVPAGLTLSAVDAGMDDDGRPRQNLMLSGTAEAAVGSYSVTITARPATGEPVSETLVIGIGDGREQVLRWDNYSPAREEVNDEVTLPAPRVIRGPENPEWSYESDTVDICTVRDENVLTLHEEGLCRVTATSAAREGFREGEVQGRITVGEGPPPPPPIISWQGYSPASFAVFGDDAPRLIEPTATVDGRSVRLDYTYKVDEISADVCEFSDSSGTLRAKKAGTCIVIARSVETDDYAAAESRPVRVTITKVRPGLRWSGYDDANLRPGGDPVSPREPQPRVSEARGELTYTYSATPRSVCSVDRNTGMLTPRSEGRCDVTVSSAETDNFLADEDSAIVEIKELPPRIDAVSCPSSADVDERITCTVRLDPNGGTPDTYSWSGGDSRGSSATYRTSFSSSGDQFVDLTVRNSAGSASASTSVRVQQPPRIDSISCSPSRPDVDENVTCTARLSGGDPDTYSWSGGDSSSSSTTYRTSFSSSGDKTVQLTVRNSAGNDSASTRVTVPEPPPPPPINISCSPLSPRVDQSVTCTAPLSGGTRPGSYSWSGGDSSSSSATYRTSFSTSGTKTVTLTVRYGDGRSDSDSTTVEVIEAPPEINSISCSPSRPIVDQSVSCTANLSGGTPDRYAWSGGSSSGSSSSYSTSFSSAGSKTVRLTVRNSAGDDNGSTSVTVPSLSCNDFDDVVATTTAANQRYAFLCTREYVDHGRLTYSITSDNTGVATVIDRSPGWFDLDIQGDGMANISWSVTANSGQSASGAFEVTVNEAPVAPTINSISCSPSSPTVNQSVSCTADVRGTAPINYSWSGGSSSGGSSASYSTSFSSSGSKTVSLRVSNSAGSDSDSTSLPVPPPPPVVNSVSCSPSPARVNQSVTCTASLSGGTPTSYSWSGGSSSGSSASYRTSFSSAGTKTVSLTARNSAGSDSDSTSVNVVAGPTINSISCSPSSPTVNQSVTCTASLSGGAPTSYSWSGGSSSGGSNATYSTSFSSSGSKTISLRVSNSAGSDSNSTSLTVPPPPPVISISCSPSSIDEGDRTRCTVSNSGGSISTYSWSASGGSPSSGSSSTYRPRFNTAGTYTVSLTASNSGGSDSDTYRSITVTVPPPPPPDIDISCTAYVFQGNSARCTVDNDGGAISSYSWSGGSSSGSSSSYSPSFSSFGRQTVRLTARNAGGSDSDSIPVDVLAWPAPTYGRCGSDGIRVYWFNSSGYDKRWLNMTWEDVAARVPGWGEHMIGHMSQSACNSWPNGPEVHTGNWPLP